MLEKVVATALFSVKATGSALAGIVEVMGVPRRDGWRHVSLDVEGVCV